MTRAIANVMRVVSILCALGAVWIASQSLGLGILRGQHEFTIAGGVLLFAAYGMARFGVYGERP